MPIQLKDEYEVYDPVVVGLSGVITEAWIKLGKPRNVFSENGARLMDFIIDSWKEMYPNEYREFLKNREEYQHSEMSIKDQVKKGTGRSLATYPPFVYRVMKRIFTDNEFNKRPVVIKLVKKWPMFRMANKV